VEEIKLFCRSMEIVIFVVGLLKEKELEEIHPRPNSEVSFA
jgi:hypothetical protein